MDFVSFEKEIKTRIRKSIVCLEGNKIFVNPILKERMKKYFKVTNDTISFADEPIFELNNRIRGIKPVSDRFTLQLASEAFLMVGYQVTERLLKESIILDANKKPDIFWRMRINLPGNPGNSVVEARMELIRLLTTVYTMIMEEDNVWDNSIAPVIERFALPGPLIFLNAKNKNLTDFKYSFQSSNIYYFEKTIHNNMYLMYQTLNNLDKDLSEQYNRSIILKDN